MVDSSNNSNNDNQRQKITIYSPIRVAFKWFRLSSFHK